MTEQANELRTPQKQLISVTLGLFLAALLFRHYVLDFLLPWGVFFHGLPALLAISLALVGPRQGVRSRLYFGVTIGLALVGVVTGEGTICVIIAAPFVYLITALVIWRNKTPKDKEGSSSAVIPVIFLLSLASGFAPTSIQAVDTTLSISAHREAISERMASTPSIPAIEGGFLSFGFPQPTEVSGRGLELGAVRTVVFTDGGTLVMAVVETSEGSVTFKPLSDTTKIGEWVRWESAEFSWADETASLHLEYERLLKPGWYFNSIIDLGVNQAAGHLLTSLAG